MDVITMGYSLALNVYNNPIVSTDISAKRVQESMEIM